MEVELLRKGTLAERPRAGGAASPPFTPPPLRPMVADGKETREFDGRHFVS